MPECFGRYTHFWQAAQALKRQDQTPDNRWVIETHPEAPEPFWLCVYNLFKERPGAD